MARPLSPYRKGIRPGNPDSFPSFVDQELARLQVVTTQLVEAVTVLTARVEALEPPTP